MTMVPAEPSIEPALARLSKSMATSISLGSQHRRRGPAGHHRSAAVRPSRHAAAVARVLDELAQRDLAHRRSRTSPGRFTWPLTQ